MKRKKLLYFCFKRSSFVERDIAILNSAYEVSVFARPAPKPTDILSYVFLQFFFLFGKIWKSDVLVCQFVGHHTVLPVLFGKLIGRPVLLIPGGSDCVSFPSIQYGHFRKKLIAKTTAWSYRNATHICPVDESLLFCNYTYTNTDYVNQGIRFFCKDLKTPSSVIHNGYDATFFQATGEFRQPKSFLTIAGGGESETVFLRKGIDLLLDLAPLFPNCNFTIVGAEQLPVKTIPENVKILPFIALSEMPALMSRHTYYFQLSICEGFPNALCEAMLCGCVPIVSKVASMPMIIGQSGFVLEKRDVKSLQQLVKMALDGDVEILSLLARKRIVENFTLMKRRTELLQLVSSLIK